MSRISAILVLAVCAFFCACDRSSSASASEVQSQAELELRVNELTQALEAERAAHEADQRGADQDRERLECELADLRGKLVDREQEYLASMQTVAAIKPDALPKDFAVPNGAGGPNAESANAAAAPDPKLEAARAESADLLRQLRSLIAVDEVYGLDLLEVGAVSDGWTGPVVFRELDTRGRTTGSLYAERMRFEGSRAGRTLSIVLESGYESRGGERHPFDNATDADGKDGVRRIELAHVDPERWLEAAPKLFGPKSALDLDDDHTFDKEATKTALNQLLAEDAASGHYRLKDFAGVVGGVLHKVHLESFDKDGKLDRRFFADRLSVRPEGESIVILLEDGVQIRGDEKAPFLDGRFRIFLPRAKASIWKAAGVPGLVDAPNVATPAAPSTPAETVHD